MEERVFKRKLYENMLAWKCSKKWNNRFARAFPGLDDLLPVVEPRDCSIQGPECAFFATAASRQRSSAAIQSTVAGSG